LGCAFTAITQIGERMVCTGKVVEKLEQGGEKCVRLELTCANEQGEAKHKADAVVAWPDTISRPVKLHPRGRRQTAAVLL
jgi:hypothetical protein